MALHSSPFNHPWLTEKSSNSDLLKARCSAKTYVTIKSLKRIERTGKLSSML